MHMQPQKITISSSREQRLKDFRQFFPHHSGSDLAENWIGGRTEGLKRLQKIKPTSYGKTRNYLNGEVTYLSPYLRHGCISLAEAIAFTKYKSTSGNEKLLFEFAWRDYWRHIWYLSGEGIHSEMEPPKVKLRRNTLPQDVLEGNTKLPCMDSFITTLKETGYLHNHARMWLSSYLIHWLGVDWRQASQWMYHLLLDGDEASNSLSWQWVASTFGSKPYFFNQENLSKYTHNQHCEGCQATCPFNHSYESLSDSLFQPTSAPAKIYPSVNIPVKHPAKGSAHIILFHDEMLSPNNPLYLRSERKVFVFDPLLYQGWAIKRLQFLADCLAEMPEVEVWIGDTLAVLHDINAGSLETQMTPNRTFRKLLAPCQVTYIDEPSIYSTEAKTKLHTKGIMRFSKYWNEVGAEILKR